MKYYGLFLCERFLWLCCVIKLLCCKQEVPSGFLSLNRVMSLDRFVLTSSFNCLFISAFVLEVLPKYGRTA